MSVSSQAVPLNAPSSYTGPVPKLWNETIEAHRHEVHAAILDTTWALASDHGLRAVTMSRIAEVTGIGRATLYRYFPDVEAILLAWHQRHIAGHLEHLAELRDHATDPGAGLHAVLNAYALICYRRGEHGGPELGALLHRGEHVTQVQRQLIDLIRDLLIEVAQTGDLRQDLPPEDLASYCLHALAAASTLSSPAAARQLVTITLAGLRPSADPL